MLGKRMPQFSNWSLGSGRSEYQRLTTEEAMKRINRLARNIIILPAGWTYQPAHSKCPQCGCDLQQYDKPITAEDYQAACDYVKERSGQAWFPRVPGELITSAKRCLKWMVNKLSCS